MDRNPAADAAARRTPESRDEWVAKLEALFSSGTPDALQRAETFLGKLSEEAAKKLASVTVCGAVLARIEARNLDRPDVLKAVAKNPATDPETLQRLARSTQPEVLEALVLNPEAISREDVTNALCENTNFPRETIERIMAAMAQSPSDDSDKRDDPNMPLSRRIMLMKAPEKVKLALMGTKEARTLLVRDANSLVNLAVINSPKIGIDEIENFVRARVLQADTIRVILRRKQWLKNQNIRRGLATNPKTPLPFALRLLSNLSMQDLKSIALSREVPQQISQQAKAIVKRRVTNG